MNISKTKNNLVCKEIELPGSESAIINGKEFKKLTLQKKLDHSSRFYIADWMNFAALIFLQKTEELKALLIEKEKSSPGYVPTLFSSSCKAICEELGDKKQITLVALSAIRGPKEIISIALDQTKSHKPINLFPSLSIIDCFPLGHQVYIVESLFSRGLRFNKDDFSSYFAYLFFTLGKIQNPLQVVEKPFRDAQQDFLHCIHQDVSVKSIAQIVVEYTLGDNVGDFLLTNLHAQDVPLNTNTKNIMNLNEEMIRIFNTALKRRREEKIAEFIRQYELFCKYKETNEQIPMRNAALKVRGLYEALSDNPPEYKEQYEECGRIMSQ